MSVNRRGVHVDMINVTPSLTMGELIRRYVMVVANAGIHTPVFLAVMALWNIKPVILLLDI